MSIHEYSQNYSNSRKIMQLIEKKNMIKNKGLGFYMNSISSLFIVLVILNPVQAKNKVAKSFHPIENIYNTAKIFLEKHSNADPTDTEVSLGKIDPRIKFTQCDTKLAAFFPQGVKKIGKMTVGVRCNGKVKWKLFIAAKIERYETVWIAKHSLATNDTINQKDLSQQRVRIDSLRQSPMKDIHLIRGTSPKKRIRAGSIIYQDAICMVCHGDKVSIVANNSFINVSVEGVALGDAKLGENVKIRNLQSKRIFTAIVIGKRQLSVKLAKNLNRND